MSHYPNERLAKSMSRLRPHGTRTRYDQGCRCLECKRIKAYRAAKLRAERAAGAPTNAIVPATKAQSHLLKLRKQGVGMNAIEEFSGISRTILKKIRYGTQTRLRQANERKILAVTPDLKIDRSKVPAKRARQMILELYEEGFTPLEIGKRMGLKNRVQIPRKGNILAKTEMRIEIFYNRYMVA